MKKRITIIILSLTAVIFLLCFSACSGSAKTVINKEINGLGELVVYYSDGSVENWGFVEQNSQGYDSDKTVISTEINENGELVVCYSDGSFGNLGVVGQDIQNYINEKCKYGLHEFEFGFYQSIYPEENTKEIFVCKNCGVTTERPHEHTFGEAVVDGYAGYSHKVVCSTCNAVKWEHHTFCDEQGMKLTDYTVNGFDYTLSCAECGFTKTVNALNLKEVEHGRIEVIATSPETVIKAIPDEGYYFEKYKVSQKTYFSCSSILWDYPSESEYDYSLAIVSCPCGFNGDSFLAYEYEPIFTDVNPFPADVDEIKINSICDTGRDIDIEYAFSCQDGKISISYYIPEDDAVLVKRTHVEKGNVLVLNGKHTLPHVGGCMLFSNSVTEVNFYFVDTTNKHVGIGSRDIIKPDMVFISDETGLITFESGGFVSRNLNDNSSVGYFVDYWTDLNGNVVSKEKVFTTRIASDTEYHAVMKTADVLYKDSDTEIYYLFSDNGEGLTLEGIYKLNQIGRIKVPESIDGKAVTEIGDYAFLTNFLNGSRDYPYSVEIPESVKKISKTAFYGLNDIVNITVEGDRDFTFEMFTKQEFPNYFGGAFNALKNAEFNVTENTLKNMVKNLVASFVDCEVDIEFVSEDHLGANVLGHYEGGSKKICILESQSYSFQTLFTLAHEIRHFYQEIAIGNVSGLSVDDLLIKPTDDQIGAWKYLDYPIGIADYEKYYYNAREIDARNFAKALIGISENVL